MNYFLFLSSFTQNPYSYIRYRLIFPLTADCQYRLAEIYANGHRWMKAKEHYENAIALNPSLKNDEMEKALAQHD